ncbi:phosphopantetheine-binding protein (plasmid) [Streptomyces galilaeus]
MTMPSGPTRQEIREAVAALVDLPAGEVADDANLVQLGLKSLHLMQLVNGWRRSGLTVKFRDLAADPTVEAWSAHLARHTPAAG